MTFICVFCVFMLHLWGIFILEKKPKISGVIVVCSGLKRIGNSLKNAKWLAMWNIEKLKIFFALLLWCMASKTFLTNLFSFLPLKNISVTVGLHFLFDSISATTSSNTINTLLFLLDYSLVNFHKHHQLFMKNEWMPLDFLIF